MAMTPEERIQHTIERGNKYPFDGRTATDTAHVAALGVFADLTDRRGVGDELEDIDDEVKTELVDSLAAIIRQVFAQSV